MKTSWIGQSDMKESKSFSLVTAISIINRIESQGIPPRVGVAGPGQFS